jgi:hypothetical protein
MYKAGDTTRDQAILDTSVDALFAIIAVFCSLALIELIKAVKTIIPLIRNKSEPKKI